MWVIKSRAFDTSDCYMQAPTEGNSQEMWTFVADEALDFETEDLATRFLHQYIDNEITRCRILRLEIPPNKQRWLDSLIVEYHERQTSYWP